MTAYARAQQGGADAAVHAADVKLIADADALDAARANIQARDGIGFTAGIDAHLYLKRIHALNEPGGNPRAVRARLNSLPAAA